MLRKLWRDECGAVVSAEIVVIVSVLVIALMVGWALLRNVVFDIVTCADVFNDNGEGDIQ